MSAIVQRVWCAKSNRSPAGHHSAVPGEWFTIRQLSMANRSAPTTLSLETVTAPKPGRPAGGFSLFAIFSCCVTCMQFFIEVHSGMQAPQCNPFPLSTSRPLLPFIGNKCFSSFCSNLLRVFLHSIPASPLFVSLTQSNPECVPHALFHSRPTMLDNEAKPCPPIHLRNNLRRKRYRGRSSAPLRLFAPAAASYNIHCPP